MAQVASHPSMSGDVIRVRAAIDEQVLRLFAMISEGLAGATEAFLAEDRDRARALIAADQAVDSLQSDIEALINAELGADVPPTAVRTRGLVARFLERLGDHAVNVARRIAELPQGDVP